MTKFQNAHVFVVDKYSYPVHINKGFCGVKNPKGGGRLGLLADIKAYRKGDLVFFYHMRVDEPPLQRGFRDVFRIISNPFYDDSDVVFDDNKVLGKCNICGYPYSEKVKKKEANNKCSNPDNSHDIPKSLHILPYRVLIEPIMLFDRSLDDNTAYVDPEDKGELSTLRWRKISGAGRERSAQHILPEEVEKLIRLLKKVNNDQQSKRITNNYINIQEAEKKKILKTLEIKRDISSETLFSIKRNGSFYGEYGLEAWILENIDKEIDVLKDIVGSLEELEYFGNGVQYGIGGEKTDVLLLHKKDGKRFKATVIELKKDDIDLNTIDQVLNPTKQNYAKWIGQLVTANCEPAIEKLEIQPVMVGFNITEDSIERIKGIERDHKTFSEEIEINYQYRNRPKVKVKVFKPILLSYKVEDDIVNFTKKDYSL